MSKIYYSAIDISVMLGVSKAKAYGIIRQLNEELQEKGFLVLQGKVPVAYFDERWYGLSEIHTRMQGA